jgi:hypothetical protein
MGLRQKRDSSAARLSKHPLCLGGGLIANERSVEYELGINSIGSRPEEIWCSNSSCSNGGSGLSRLGSRGRREAIFSDEADRGRFLLTAGEVCEGGRPVQNHHAGERAPRITLSCNVQLSWLSEMNRRQQAFGRSDGDGYLGANVGVVNSLRPSGVNSRSAYVTSCLIREPSNSVTESCRCPRTIRLAGMGR